MAARKATDPIQRFQQEVALGRFDEHLVAVSLTLGARLVEIAARSPWVIEVAGITIDEDELTLRQMAVVERVTGKKWADIDPLDSAVMAAAIVETVLISRDGLSAEEAREKVDAITVTEFVAGVSRRQVSLPDPLPAAAPS